VLARDCEQLTDHDTGLELGDWRAAKLGDERRGLDGDGIPVSGDCVMMMRAQVCHEILR
jgi:hypothetical protein